jgi:hypothetical protein
MAFTAERRADAVDDDVDARGMRHPDPDLDATFDEFRADR